MPSESTDRTNKQLPFCHSEAAAGACRRNAKANKPLQKQKPKPDLVVRFRTDNIGSPVTIVFLTIPENVPKVKRISAASTKNTQKIQHFAIFDGRDTGSAAARAGRLRHIVRIERDRALF